MRRAIGLALGLWGIAVMAIAQVDTESSVRERLAVLESIPPGSASSLLRFGKLGVDSADHNRCLGMSGGPGVTFGCGITASLPTEAHFATISSIDALHCVLNVNVAGAAGETIQFVPRWSNSLTTSDGPAISFPFDNTIADGTLWSGDYAGQLSPWSAGSLTLKLVMSNPATTANVDINCSLEMTP